MHKNNQCDIKVYKLCFSWAASDGTDWTMTEPAYIESSDCVETAVLEFLRRFPEIRNRDTLSIRVDCEEDTRFFVVHSAGEYLALKELVVPDEYFRD